MDQYFGRMRSLMNNKDLPARIRFLLQDTVELRENNWVPRKAFIDNGPKTINQIRQDAVKVSLGCCHRHWRCFKATLLISEFSETISTSDSKKLRRKLGKLRKNSQCWHWPAILIVIFLSGFGCFYSTDDSRNKNWLLSRKSFLADENKAWSRNSWGISGYVWADARYVL